MNSTRLFVLILMVMTLTVNLGWACPDGVDNCHAPDIKEFIRLACSPSDEGCDPSNHIDVRGLFKLACDANSGVGCDYRKDLKGLMKLACDVNNGFDCNFQPELDKLKQLACESGDPGCRSASFKPNLDHIMRLACDVMIDCLRPDDGGQFKQLAMAPKSTFMGTPKSLGKGSALDDMEKRVSDNPKPAPKKSTENRLENADPKDFPIIMAFLSKKIPVNAQDSKGNTLLHYFAAQGNVHAVKTLLEKGADPAIMNKDGITPVEGAMKNNQTEVAALMMGK